MTPIAKAALLDAPVLALAVAVELDPAKVLAWVSGGFFLLLSFFIQREWARHETSHATIEARHVAHDNRLAALERTLAPEPHR